MVAAAGIAVAVGKKTSLIAEEKLSRLLEKNLWNLDRIGKENSNNSIIKNLQTL